MNNNQPSVNVAINKSRLKQYKESTGTPVYYLKKGSEFQLEIFNPTKDVILAQIELNGKRISQGGLILNPGERVFLERYLDVPNKFKFETYEVSNSSEVQKAIQDNGDIKVQFFREQQPPIYNPFVINTPNLQEPWVTNPWWGGNNVFYKGDSNYIGTTPMGVTYSTASGHFNIPDANVTTYSVNKKHSDKTIETGRVDKGSHSNQQIKTIQKDFETFPFYTVECKLIPHSQMPVQSSAFKPKSYCTQCGHKFGKTDKFCSQCGCRA